MGCWKGDAESTVNKSAASALGVTQGSGGTTVGGHAAPNGKEMSRSALPCFVDAPYLARAL